MHAVLQGAIRKHLQPRYYVYLGVVVAVAAIVAWALSLQAFGVLPDRSATGASVAGSAATGEGTGVAAPLGATSLPVRLLPRTVGGLALASEISGDSARAQVEQLHGKVLGAGLDQAWIGQYGDPPQATVWVTRSVRRDDAEALLVRMATRLGDSESPFQLIGPVAFKGVHGYKLEGMGQKHYYFLLGSDLYWLAIDPEYAVSGFGDLVRFGASMEAR